MKKRTKHLADDHRRTFISNSIQHIFFCRSFLLIIDETLFDILFIDARNFSLVRLYTTKNREHTYQRVSIMNDQSRQI